MPRNRVVRRSFVGRRAPGRLTEWGALAFASAEDPLAANSVVLLAVGDATFLDKRPLTIVRTVGSLSVQSDQNVAVEYPFGAWGMAIVSDQAVAIGVTAVPNPVSNVTSDLWFAYGSFSAEGSASTNVGRPLMQFPFDFRSQRKVQDGENVIIVVANASAADGLNFVLNLRFLVKLA